MLDTATLSLPARDTAGAISALNLGGSTNGAADNAALLLLIKGSRALEPGLKLMALFTLKRILDQCWFLARRNAALSFKDIG
jgi:hypothetical protein